MLNGTVDDLRLCLARVVDMEMKRVYQQVSHPIIGDCFRACMASLLELPAEVLPNDHSPEWHFNWQRFLKQFGLTLSHEGGPKAAIYLQQPWMASVKSLNYENNTHSILMHEGNVVLHDPSRKKRYKTGMRLNSDTVQGGTRIDVLDFSKLHKLEEFRKHLEANK